MLSAELMTDELLSIFAFYAAVMAFQFVLVSFITGQERLKTKVSMHQMTHISIEHASRGVSKNFKGGRNLKFRQLKVFWWDKLFCL